MTSTLLTLLGSPSLYQFIQLVARLEMRKPLCVFRRTKNPKPFRLRVNTFEIATSGTGRAI